MSYNGSGTFNINTSGQPVVAGTVITATAFNLLTADLATGLTTAMTKDGQTTTTARIPFAQGISSTLVTDATNTTSGSIITAGGVGIAKALYVGTNANVAGTLDVTGTTTLTNPVINNIKMGYSTTATAAGTTTLTISSNYRQFFTGTLAQTIVLPVTSTLVTGMAYEIENNSTGLLTVNSSGGNLVGTIPAGVCAHAVCIGTTLTTAADWDWDYISNTTITGTGSAVLGTSPTITSPTIDTITSAAATALTLKSAGTTALTISTSQAATFASTVADSVAILRPLVASTAVASTSGTSIEFTNIPSWCKRITVMFNGVSAASGNNLVLQLGTGSTTYTITGYLSTRSFFTTVVSTGNRTTGFDVACNSAGAEAINGHAVLTNISGNIWILSSITGNTGDSRTTLGGGNIALSATLTAVRLISSSTGNPADAFDAGSINILYE